MFSSQQFVVTWIECAVAAFLLLSATKWILPRLRQPVDRINLITLSLIVSAFAPALLTLTGIPGIQLGLIPKDTKPSIEFAFESPQSLSTDQFYSSGIELREARASARPDEMQVLVSPSGHAADQLPAALTPAESAGVGLHTPSIVTTKELFSFWTIAATTLITGHLLAFAWFIASSSYGYVQLRNLSRRSTRPDSRTEEMWRQITGNAASRVRLLASNEIVAPMVCGLVRSTVFLPKSIVEGDESSLRYCLAHEWSHLRNRDLITWSIVNVCQVWLWYQPFVWRLSRELRVCQDLLADDFAAGIHTEPLSRVEYSELLLSIAKRTMAPRIAGTMALHERSSQLSRRIKSLLTNSQTLQTRSTRIFLCASCVVLTAVALVVCSLKLSSANAEVAGLPNQLMPVESPARESDQTSKAVTLTGNILQNDKPVAGVTVKLHRDVRLPNGRNEYAQVCEANTDTKGTYVLTGLRSGDQYYIEIQPSFAAADPTWQHQSPYIQTLPDSAEGTLELPDVKLVKLSQSIAGMVVDPDGKPVPGARIGVQLLTGEHLAKTSPTASPPWTETDRRGRFHLKGLPDAPLIVFAYFADLKGGPIRFMAKQEIKHGQQDIRIVLDPSLQEQE